MKLVKFFIPAVIVCLALLFHSGCGPQANIALNFSGEQTANYKAVSLSRKDYLFDQPGEDKKTEKMSETRVEMIYEQTIASVDEKGNANADITIKGIKYLKQDSGGMEVDFDSSRDADAQKPIAGLIGQTYQIKIAPDGKVLETSGLRGLIDSVKGRTAKKLAEVILGEKAIEEIHTVLALPDTGKNLLSQGDTWVRAGSSPKGSLVSKSFQKNYTVKDITETPEKMIANIEMNAVVASSDESGLSQTTYGSMGIFGNMFDSEDSYTGKLILDLNTGKIKQYQENFIGKYTAVQFPEGGQGEKDEQAEPDMLKLGYTRLHSIEAVD